jgi:hypothetical protein
VDEMLGIKEPCLKLVFKLGLLSYTFLFILTFLFSNWRIGVGHVIVTVLFFVQFYSLLFFFQRRGVPCEVQHDGMTISVPAFTYSGLLNSVAIFGLVLGHGGLLVILVYIAMSTLMFIFAVWLAKDLERVSKAESKT